MRPARRGSHRSVSLRHTGFKNPSTRTHVRLLGPCFKTGRMESPQTGAPSTQAPEGPSLGRVLGSPTDVAAARAHASAPACAATSARADQHPEPSGKPKKLRPAYGRGASLASIRFPPGNFKHSLTLFSKSFSSFPRGTCSLSVSRAYLALDGIYHPIRAAFPNNPTRRQRPVMQQGPGPTGLSPSPAPPSRGLGPGPSLGSLLQTTLRTAARTARFSCWAVPGSLAATRGILVSFSSSAYLYA